MIDAVDPSSAISASKDLDIRACKEAFKQHVAKEGVPLEQATPDFRLAHYASQGQLTHINAFGAYSLAQFALEYLLKNATYYLKWNMVLGAYESEHGTQGNLALITPFVLFGGKKPSFVTGQQVCVNQNELFAKAEQGEDKLHTWLLDAAEQNARVALHLRATMPKGRMNDIVDPSHKDFAPYALLPQDYLTRLAWALPNPPKALKKVLGLPKEQWKDRNIEQQDYVALLMHPKFCQRVRSILHPIEEGVAGNWYELTPLVDQVKLWKKDDRGDETFLTFLYDCGKNPVRNPLTLLERLKKTNPQHWKTWTLPQVRPAVVDALRHMKWLDPLALLALVNNQDIRALTVFDWKEYISKSTPACTKDVGEIDRALVEKLPTDIKHHDYELWRKGVDPDNLVYLYMFPMLWKALFDLGWLSNHEERMRSQFNHIERSRHSKQQDAALSELLPHYWSEASQTDVAQVRNNTTLLKVCFDNQSTHPQLFKQALSLLEPSTQPYVWRLQSMLTLSDLLPFKNRLEVEWKKHPRIAIDMLGANSTLLIDDTSKKKEWIVECIKEWIKDMDALTQESVLECLGKLKHDSNTQGLHAHISKGLLAREVNAEPVERKKRKM